MNSAETQEAVQGEVSRRMAKAAEEIAAKYAKGEGGVETSVDAPTGNAYKEVYAKEQQQQQQRRRQQEQKENKQRNASERVMTEEEMDEIDEEDEGEDPELRRIKMQRLRQLKQEHNQRLENLGKGHGQLLDITQDEFIGAMTTSMTTVCLFYHKDFQRCEVMNHHLQKLAQRHIESKFVKIDAEKAPFFVEKLRVRTLPTVVVFKDGVAVDKIVGFESLAEQMPEGREDEWPTILLARLLAAKGAIDSSAVVDDDEVEARMKARAEEMRRNSYLAAMQSSLLAGDDEDDDFDLDS